ncbi:MAG: hypothetical protein ACYCPV_02700, partial [Thermoplasmata archaeon]
MLGWVVFVVVTSSLVVPGIGPTVLAHPREAAPLATPYPVSAPVAGRNGSFSVETTTVLANNTTLPGNFLASNG